MFNVLMSYIRPTEFKTHYVVPPFYLSADRPNCAKMSFIEMRTYFSFGLILRDIPNSITPQTTLRLLLISVGLLVLPHTHQCRRPPPPPLTLSLPPFFFWSCPGQMKRRSAATCVRQTYATTVCSECAR